MRALQGLRNDLPRNFREKGQGLMEERDEGDAKLLYVRYEAGKRALEQRKARKDGQEM